MTYPVSRRELEDNLNRLLSWIQATDTKAELVLIITMSMSGVVAAVFRINKCEYQFWDVVLLSITSSFLLSSIFSIMVTLFPRTKGPAQGSLIYFGGIVSNTAEEFKDKLNNCSEDDYRADLIRQCHRNAEIAKAKYDWVQLSLTYLFIAIPFWCLTVLFLYR